MSFPISGTPIIQAFNPPPFSVNPAGDVEAIGFLVTASGNALLVAITGAPIVIAVNLDLADDEVAIGGPDSAGTRRLFQGRVEGANNVIETVPRLVGAQALALGKAEDTAAADGDVGVPAYAVRRDADVADAADGDYTPLHTDSDGRLKVDVPDLGAPVGTTVTVTDVSTPLVAAAGATVRERTVIIRNVSFGAAGRTVVVGGVAVTFAAGMPLNRGANVNNLGDTITLSTLGAVSGICDAADSAEVRVLVLEGS